MANIFGGDQSKTPFGTGTGTSSNIFGNLNSTPAKSLFGTNSTPNLFGSSTLSSTTTPQTSPTKPSAPLGGTSSTSAPSLFAPQPPTISSTAPPTFAFPPTNVIQHQINPPASSSTNSGTLFGGSAAPKPAQTTSLFGTTTTKPSTETPTPATSTSTSLFGAPAVASTSSNNLFGSTPSQQATKPAGEQAQAGNPPASQSTDPKAPSLFGGGGGGLFGSKTPSTLPAKPSPLASKDQPTFSTPTSSSTPDLKSTTTTSNTPNKPASGLAVPSLLRGKTMDDLINRWSTELDERTTDFRHMADEIAAWDQVLIQNGDQISNLYGELQRIEPIQTSIDQTLDYVETQQAELSAALDEYERQLSTHQPSSQDLSALPGPRARTAAQEREQAYRLAEEVHSQLNDMATSLGTMISELNTLSGPRTVSSTEEVGGSIALINTPSEEDPIVQVAAILNAHLNSLNVIGEVTQDLGSKIGEIERRVTNTKVEFGLETRQQSDQVTGGGGGLVPTDDRLPLMNSSISNPYRSSTPRR